MPQTEGQRNQFVDFRALRKSLSFAEVLKHYGVEIKHQKGNRHVGFCPLPTHQGKKRSPSFSAKLDFGVWHCFGCRASGNLIEFAVRMEGLDPTDKQQFRQVALKLQEVFGAPKPTEVEVAKPEKSPPAKSLAASPAKELPVVINEPLNFVLKNLDQDHPYLKERGFTPETIRSFGLGYCSRALMSGRVVIPIHDEGNRLVGYAGRLVCDNQISEYHPKYKLPAPREREGRRLEFRKSLLVYNANRLREPVERLIVVEGFPSVWWLTQHRYPDVVAVMGNDCSEEQGLIIAQRVRVDGAVWILTDGDDGGRDCAESIFRELAPYRYVRWAKLPQGQPTDCTPGDLEELLWPV
jgi:DNA primase